MNPWPFVISAFAVTVGGTGALIWWAAATMRRAEAKLEGLRGR